MKFSAAALQMLRSGGTEVRERRNGGFASHVLRSICNAAEYRIEWGFFGMECLKIRKS